MATENNNKNLNVPNLRFPEFSGEWEKYRLKDIANISKERIGINMLSNNNYISTENMKSDFGGVDVAINLPASGNVIKFQKGDTLLSNIRPYLKKIWQAKFDGGCSADIFVFRSNILCNSDFLYYTLANEKFISYAMSGAKGVKMPRGDKEQILKYELHLPTTIEQNKITSFLSLLDERIATQIKIIEDLKKLKSAISNKLFARKDLLEKQITISEIGTLKNGYAFQSSTYNPAGSYKIITIANVSGERYIDIDSCNCIMRIPEDIQTHQVLKQDDILISLTGNVGRVSLCTEGSYLLNQRVGLLQLKPGVNREYIYQALSCRRYEQTMISCGQGAAQMNIGKGDVEDYTIPYSANSLNLEVVASTLKTYDLLISVEVDRLRLFMQQKQFLLAQMFI